MALQKKTVSLALAASAAMLIPGCLNFPKDVETNPAVTSEKRDPESWSGESRDHAATMRKEGREVSRHDTFGSEEFWGGQLRLHEAIAGAEKGGIGPGVTARQALQLGLKVDIGRLPKILVEVNQGGA